MQVASAIAGGRAVGGPGWGQFGPPTFALLFYRSEGPRKPTGVRDMALAG